MPSGIDCSMYALSWLTLLLVLARCSRLRSSSNLRRPPQEIAQQKGVQGCVIMFNCTCNGHAISWMLDATPKGIHRKSLGLRKSLTPKVSLFTCA